MSIILTVAPSLLKGRVELERIHIFPIFGEERKFAIKFQSLAVVALNQHVGIKTSPIEVYVTIFIFLN